MYYKLPKLICLLCCVFAVNGYATDHSLELQKGLKRFDKQTVFGSISNLDIKDIYIGDNVLAKSISLVDAGGRIHNITGGSRSSKVKISFYQPYQESRLEQLLELKFNKKNGFIEQIGSTYSIDSAYLDLTPVREKVLLAAIKKYGEPLSLADIQQITGRTTSEIRVSSFIDKLRPNSDVAESVKMYFSKRNISKNSKFTSNTDGRAIMHTGFDLCYLWQENDFEEILSLCAFDSREANASNRGVELNLYNFRLQQVITEQKKVSDKEDPFSIGL
ncbi:MAG: hypothetical protein ACI808_000704 [Paraglaciecola sp.]|jgi:hypothetical protein